MPLYASGFFIPTSKSIPYLIEDIYVRGGWRTVADMEALYAIKTSARKFGMVAFVESESSYFHVPGPDKSGSDAWKPLDITKYINVGSGLSLEVDAETGVVTLVGGSGLPDPSGASTGMSLVLDSEGNPVWGTVSSLPEIKEGDAGKSLVVGASGYELKSLLPDVSSAEDGSALVVQNGELAVGTPASGGLTGTMQEVTVDVGGLPIGSDKQLSVDVEGNVFMVAEFSTNYASLALELHSTDSFDDVNPYRFVSSAVSTSDQGVTYNEDATVTKHRRYGFYIDAMGTSKLHLKVINEGGTDRASVTASLKLLGIG